MLTNKINQIIFRNIKDKTAIKNKNSEKTATPPMIWAWLATLSVICPRWRSSLGARLAKKKTSTNRQSKDGGAFLLHMFIKPESRVACRWYPGFQHVPTICYLESGTVDC